MGSWVGGYTNVQELVSVIMPTLSNREALRSLATKCFLQQDYPNKELILVEDEGTIGYKLNLGCERAKGNLFCRFDDDDWSAPNRLTDQVNRLISNNKNLTGYRSIYFWDDSKKQASYYHGAPNYCLGTSMLFTRKYWESNKFPLANIGEDLFFQRKAKQENDVISIEADQMMVARLHGSNISSGRIAFPVVDKNKLPQAFFDAIGG